MNYWQHKISLFLHDPVHKAFKISGHEKRAAAIAEFLHQPVATKELYQVADMIASGLTRSALPGYDGNNTAQNGSVDLNEFPVLTHPLVKNSSLTFGLPEAITIEKIHSELLDLLKKDLGVDKSVEELTKLKANLGENAPLNSHYKVQEEWDKALYYYLFFALKKRLRNTNVGQIGGLWDLLPADTRMPDHSIWQHCALTSAVGSSMKEDPDGSVSLAVFSITPVQPFIAKARKLRDSWTASVILSYLSFTGIREIMDKLGPDHIVYPSLHDQSLVESWIGKEFHLEQFLKENEIITEHNNNGKSIASFPNKFIFLCGTTKVEEVLLEVQKTIQAEWERIARKVRQFLEKELGAGDTFSVLFNHQISDYWQYSWASARLLTLKDEEITGRVLDPDKWKIEFDTIREFAKAFTNGDKTARCYSASHSLVQSLLASAKLKPARIRKAQKGEKCPLCGEHEVLHDYVKAGETGAHEYSTAVKTFWDSARGKFNSAGSTSQLGANERICAICATKRFLPRVMANDKSELLYGVLGIADTFPATTELAANEFITKIGRFHPLTEGQKKDLIDLLHESELEGGNDDQSVALREIIELGKKCKIRFTDRDKYYAVLLMDGDKMGDLLNGKVHDATWNDVLHPELKRRFENAGFQDRSPLRKVGINAKRLLNPSVHAAISDSLNSFARFGVAPVIKESGGRLIYAGGDDVCAVLPLDSALDAAEKICTAYTMKFVKYTKDGAVPIVKPDCSEGKISMHLGDASGISISGALIIAHHKEPLREVLRDAHTVLDSIAKNSCGRNALAIRLKKRSGGDRDIAFKWDAKNPFMEKETLLQSFKTVMNTIDDSEASTSLIYKMEQLRDAVRPLVANASFYDYSNKKWLGIAAINRDRVVKLFAYEVGHSGVPVKGSNKEDIMLKKQEIAARLAGLCIMQPSCTKDSKPQKKDECWFNAEGPVIGRFLAPREEAN
ncbi:MAG TPA: type III-B CRISPR-associated protein Cas10/Cmr2 [Chitinispirillaceae bacterium]|nr:type III-B CRISPR-associated protein Cas10/Cmr2 [Chitinispirillaceae bacterium]